MDQSPIETKNLTLRKLVPSDVIPFWNYRSQEVVTRFQGFDVMNESECLDFIQSQASVQFGTMDEWIQLAIVLKSAGELIGDCGICLQQSPPNSAAIGITLNPEFQHKGFAKETLKAIIQFLFNQFHIQQIIEIVDAENIASIKLLKSLGFEATASQRVWFKGHWCNELTFVLSKKAFT